MRSPLLLTIYVDKEIIVLCITLRITFLQMNSIILYYNFLMESSETGDHYLKI